MPFKWGLLKPLSKKRHACAERDLRSLLAIALMRAFRSEVQKITILAFSCFFNVSLDLFIVFWGKFYVFCGRFESPPANDR